MSKLYRTMIVLAMAAMLNGCAGPKESELLTDAPTAAMLGYRIQWQCPLQMNKSTWFRYVEPMGDVVATVDTKNLVSVIDASSGTLRFVKKLGGPVDHLSRPQLAVNGVLACTEREGYIYNLQTGEVSNHITMDVATSTSPAVDSNYAIFGAPSGLVYAKDLKTNLTRWSYQMAGAIVVDPVIADNLVIVADETGQVAAINPLNGHVLWRKAAPPWKRISAPLAANETTAFVASEDQTFYAFDRTTGRFWKKPTQTPLTVAPVVLGDNVYLRVPGGQLICFYSFSGESLWESDVAGTPFMILGKKLMMQLPGKINVVDVETGKLMSTVELPKVQRVVSDKPVNGNLYLINNDGRITKLAPIR
jgi:outer membrane protein assembly factor BamB